jgi:hypothetical protein
MKTSAPPGASLRLVPSLLALAWASGCTVPITLAHDPADAAAQPDVTPSSDIAPADVPIADVPTVDIPTVDIPTVDIPTVDIPTVDIPTVDVPVADVVDAGPCPAGEGRVGGACVVLTAPRLVAPLATSAVTSHRPTLRWAPATGVPGARVELCRDRACASPVATIDVASGDSVRPAADLAPGVYFWRARGAGGGAVGLAPGVTWSFYVGARSTAVDTSWSTVIDLEGDGYPDTLVLRYTPAYRYSNQIDTWAGSAAGLPANATGQLLGPVRADYQTALAADFTGDGFTDLALTTSGPTLLYPGSAAGPSAATSITVPTLAGPTSFAGALFPTRCRAADYDRDGRLDLACATSEAVWSFRGDGAGGFAAPATLTLPAVPSPEFWSSSAVAADYDGDGYVDLAVLRSNDVRVAPDSGAHSVATLLRGGPSGLAPAGTLAVEPAGAGACAAGVARSGSGPQAGDLNGDGYADLALVLYPSIGGGVVGACIYTVAGGPDGLAAGRAAWLVDARSLSSAQIVAGDVNGDGFTDLLYSSAANGGSRSVGVVTLRGGPAGLVDDRSAVITSAGAGEDLAGPFAPADYNGDGFADVVIATRIATDAGVVLDGFLLFEGSAAGLPAAPTRRLVYPWTPYTGP